MADYNKIERKRRELWLIKSDIELKAKLDDLRVARIKNNLDRKTIPFNDLLHAAFRFEPLLDILKKAKINKKAQTQFNIFTFIITAFLVVVFFGGLIYVMGLVTDVMHQAGINNEVNAGNPGYVNMTEAADLTFGKVNDSIKSLRLVALMYILGLAVCIIVTNALMKIHPLFFFAYVLIILLAVIFSPPISNAYENLLNSNIYAGELNNFSASNFFILHMPLIVLVIGILGGIFLFINLIRTDTDNLQ